MRTILAFSLLALPLMAQRNSLMRPPEDNQREVLPPPTTADVMAMSKTLSLREAGYQELLKQLESLRRDPGKLEELRRDPEKLKQFMDKLPPEFLPSPGAQAPPLPRPVPEPGQPPPVLPPQPSPEGRPPPGRMKPEDFPRPSESALDPKVRGNPALKQFVRFWEKNVGPLDRTPALKSAFAELLTQSLAADEGGNPFAGQFAESLFGADSPLGQEASGFFEAASGLDWNIGGLSGGWNWSPRISGADFSGFGFGGGGSSSVTTDSEGSLMLPLAIAGAFLILVLLLRRGGFGWFDKGEQASLLPEIPFRPEAIRNRGDLVIAFEALALKTFGPESASWNHRSIAAKAGASFAEAADDYERARYSPDDFSGDTLRDAQQRLIRLGSA